MANSFNNWPTIAENLHTALSQVVRKTALDGQAAIQSQIQANGQVDTGFMLNSVYAVTDEGSTYGQAGTPPGDATLLPEVDAPTNDTTAYIAVGASYAGFQNYGTRYLPPRPFFEPGIDAVKPSFEAALASIDGKLGGSIS